MKYFSTLILLITGLSSIYAGGIPKNMPDDFGIRYTSKGGEISLHEEIFIQIGDCHAKARKDFSSEAIRYNFTLTREDLMPLYDALRSLKAFTIKYGVDPSNNSGGEFITYIVNGKFYQVNHGKEYSITDKNRLNHFNLSVDLITAFADRHRP